MILATEALAAAGSAMVATGLAIAHARRLIMAGEQSTRLKVAVMLFAAFNLYLFLDELYWGVARSLGMPGYLLNGWAPLSFKIFAMYVLSGGVILLYSRSYKMAKAVGIPTAFWLASIWLSKSF